MKPPLNPSDAVRRLNPELYGFSIGSAGSAPVMERDTGDGCRPKDTPKAQDAARFLVRVESVRKRLLDTDNICAKYVVDCCRYAGILSSDAPDQTEIQVSQRKALKGESERTIIEVYKL